MIIQLIITAIVIAYIIFMLYVKIKFPFWSIQPVFHFYNILYWIDPPGIIRHDLPLVNKFCDFYHITSYKFNEITSLQLQKCVNFIQYYYLNNNNAHYYPELENFLPYFQGFTEPCFISLYEKPTLLLEANKIDAPINSKELLGLITGRPLNITLHNKPTFCVYYIDYLCVHSSYRKKGIAPKLIQTHEYNQRHTNKKISVCLFKREGELTGIGPLVVYDTYKFSISDIPLEPLPNASLTLVDINDSNLNLLTEYIYLQKSKYKCIIVPDIGNLVSLLNTENMFLYGITENGKLIALYIFKNPTLSYHKNIALECIASISDCYFKEIFIAGFSSALHKLKEKIGATQILIENISNNDTIIQNILINTKSHFVSPTAFFLYNYALHPLAPKDTLIIY